MQCRGIGEHGTVRNKQVKRFDAAELRRCLQDLAGGRDQLYAAGVAETGADGWAEVGVCTVREEIGDEGWVVGCIAGGYMSSA